VVRFAAAGATVALVARSKDALATLAAELGGTAHPADLSDPTQVATLVNRVEDEAGPIDVLVNDAGVGTPAYFANASSDHLRRITEVNYLVPAELCRQAIPRMLGRRGGHIVNISSMADCSVFPGLVAYSASKAALSHLTAGLRADLHGLPIGTTLVELGPIPTELLAEAEGYQPTAAAFRRSYRLRLLVDVPREKVADEVVDARNMPESPRQNDEYDRLEYEERSLIGRETQARRVSSLQPPFGPARPRSRATQSLGSSR
jgi:uncharacterized protein